MAELFCGPGGLSLGAIMASKNNKSKIVPVWANDIDPDTCDTYVRNIHSGNKDSVMCAPVQEIDFNKIPDFDGLCFGFPCNDFSLVGEQKGTKGKFGPLYTYGVKAITAKNPKWFIAENVGGIESANEGKALKKILTALSKAGNGYNLTVHKYKFEEYGVPQSRHRIIITGIRKDLNIFFKAPKPTTPNPKDYVTAKMALTNPPITNKMSHNELTKQSKTVVERLMHIPAGKNAWYDGVPEHLRLNVKGARLSQIYRRLDPNKPSYTITGSGGGGTHGYHWAEPRALTNRERARLQSFPDSFDFSGSKESVRKQIGMAVPPLGAMHIFDALLKTLSNSEYAFIDTKYHDNEFLINLNEAC